MSQNLFVNKKKLRILSTDKPSLSSNEKETIKEIN